MLCPHHGLATGPDNQCVLCHRLQRDVEQATRRARDPARKVAIAVVALMAAVATFFLVGALLDTR
jgi:hypothetical protein